MTTNQKDSSATSDEVIAFPLALNVQHPDCHKAANAFWTYWNENGETHKHGYYESTWGAINRAIRMIGVVPWTYGQAPQAATPLPEQDERACDLVADIKKLVKLSDDVGRSRASNNYAMNKGAVEKLVDLERSVLSRVAALTQQAAPDTCQWPKDKPFRVLKVGEIGDHTPWQVVMPCGGVLELNHHADDAVDEARAKWIGAALNLPHEDWSPYLKDDETPLARLRREINDNASILALLAKERGVSPVAAPEAPAREPYCIALHSDGTMTDLTRLIASSATATASEDAAEFLTTLEGASKKATDEWIAGFVRQHFGIYGATVASTHTVSHELAYQPGDGDVSTAYVNGWNDCRETVLGLMPDDPANFQATTASASEPVSKAELWDAIHQYVSDYGDQFREPPTTGAGKRCDASRNELAETIDRLYRVIAPLAGKHSYEFCDRGDRWWPLHVKTDEEAEAWCADYEGCKWRRVDGNNAALAQQGATQAPANKKGGR